MKHIVRIVFALVVVSLALMLGACAGKRVGKKSAQEAAGHYDMAMVYMYRGETEQALAELLKAEEIDPKNASVQEAKGIVYYAMEKHDKAIASYKRAIELAPKACSDARHNLGVVYTFLGRYDEAIDEFRKALEDDTYPNRANTYNAMGWAYYQNDDMENAKANFLDAIEHDRLYVVAYKNLGQVLIRTEEYQEAVANLMRAVEYSPKYAEAHLLLGVAQLKLGQQEAAKESFAAAQRLDPYGKFGASAQEYLQALP